MKKTKQRQKNVDSPVNNTKKDSDELEYALNVLDRVDMWIGSCDNKLGILIGIIGVVLTICITSDSVNSFLVFIKNLYVRVEGSKDIQATFFFVSCCYSCCSVGTSCLFSCKGIVCSY